MAQLFRQCRAGEDSGRLHSLRYVQTDATAPSILGPTMLGDVACFFCLHVA